MLKYFKEELKLTENENLKMSFCRLKSTTEILSQTISQKNQKTIELINQLKYLLGNNPELEYQLNNLESLTGFIFQCLMELDGNIKEVECLLPYK